MRGFERLATVSASIQRRAAPGGDGLTGNKSTVVAALDCTDLQALSRGEADKREVGSTLLFETRCTSSYDIQAGDWLVVAGQSYLIRAVVPYLWTPTGDTYLRLIVEEVQT